MGTAVDDDVPPDAPGPVAPEADGDTGDPVQGMLPVMLWMKSMHTMSSGYRDEQVSFERLQLGVRWAVKGAHGGRSFTPLAKISCICNTCAMEDNRMKSCTMHPLAPPTARMQLHADPNSKDVAVPEPEDTPLDGPTGKPSTSREADDMSGSGAPSQPHQHQVLEWMWMWTLLPPPCAPLHAYVYMGYSRVPI